MSVDEFRQHIQQNDFVEWEMVYEGRYYGTLRSEIERIWAEGKHVIFDVDVEGGLNLKDRFGDLALGIFVMVPSVEILAKLPNIKVKVTDRFGETYEVFRTS